MKFLTAVLATLSLSAFANEGDLVLQGAKWAAKHTGYKCAAFGADVARPAAFEKLNVSFEGLTSDSTLDNGLIKGTFTENGVTCRYNAIIFADNAASTIRLVESKAYSPSKASDCAEGKRVIDAAFESLNYLYWGHPHNLTMMVPVAGAEAVCGSNVVGINFVVSGRITK